MRAQITRHLALEHLPSGSAIDRVGDFWFVIGDDSPDLYRLDLNLAIVGTTRLFESSVEHGARIPKVVKPDLEAMTLVEWKGRQELLLFGSGSRSPARDVCYRVDVTNPAEPALRGAVSLTALYDAFRANPLVVGNAKLNLEGAASTKEAILLFQRGNISGTNVALTFERAAFMTYLDNPASPPPSFTVSAFALPTVQNRLAGFSGASALNETDILFSASVEDTADEIHDGATLGSYVGVLKLGGAGDAPLAPDWIALLEEDGKPVECKVEGLAALPSAHGMAALGITDDDMGGSELLWIEIG